MIAQTCLPSLVGGTVCTIRPDIWGLLPWQTPMWGKPSLMLRYIRPWDSVCVFYLCVLKNRWKRKTKHPEGIDRSLRGWLKPHQSSSIIYMSALCHAWCFICLLASETSGKHPWIKPTQGGRRTQQSCTLVLWRKPLLFIYTKCLFKSKCLFPCQQWAQGKAYENTLRLCGRKQ